MKNTVRLFVLVALASSLLTPIGFCAARNAPVQHPTAQDGPGGALCKPGENCVPVVDSQPIVAVLQEGPVGGNCAPGQNCIPVVDSQPIVGVLQDGPSGGGCPPTEKCVPKSATL